MLDFSKIKSKLAASQTKGERRDYSKIYYKPTLGKQKVRIVPYKDDPTNPFIEVQFHKYDTFKKYIPTLANYGEVDPILKVRKAVFSDTASTEEEKEFMKNFTPKTSIYVQVIERGKEDLGVRLWELNKTNFEAVAVIAADEEEYGDITDIVSGRDLIVEGYNEVNPITGKNYVALNIGISVNQTPLSKDAATAKKWTTEQMVPLEQYKRYTKDELEQLFTDFVSPKDEEDDDEVAAPPKAPAKAPAKAPGTKFAKVVEEEAEEADKELAPVPKAKAKPVTKPKPPVEEEEEISDLPWEQEEGQDPELAEEEEEAPAPKPKAKTVAPKAPAKPAAKAAPAAVKSKFDSLYEDDDE
jgi:hypothetical protein